MTVVDGALLLKKPEGITSFEALYPVKKHFSTSRVGHAGTLDRFASGLLLVLLGSYTKIVDLCMGLEKEYVGVVEFGKETDTLDPEGAVISTGPVPELCQIEEQIPTFLGIILQAPPAYSSVHVGGKRAYQIARLGNAVEMEPRRVEIKSIEVLEYIPPRLRIRVVCGKGTYIRSLARDLGRKCGTVAYLSSLARVRIGPLRLEEAVLLSELEKKGTLRRGEEFLSTLFPDRVLKTRPDFGVADGKPLRPSLWKDRCLQEGVYLLVSESGELEGAVRNKGGKLSYQFVVPLQRV